MSRETLLVDMDNTSWDFNGLLISRLGRIGIQILRSDLTEFYFADNLSDESARSYADVCMREAGFFATMPMIPDAKKGINELRDDFDVRLCSSPLSIHHRCEEEKREAIEQEFGREMAEDAFIGKNKAEVSGFGIIDDKPKANGLDEASWGQIYFSQPCNLGMAGDRMNDWDDRQAIYYLYARMREQGSGE